MHDWLTATGRPVVVLLPDNRSVSGTVEETLLKGFSDVPTWNITSGYTLLDTVAPRRLFVSQISAAPAGAVLLWTDVPATPPLKTSDSVGALVLGQLPREARSWRMQRNAYWTRTVHGAIFADSSDTPSSVVLKTNAGWRGARAADPILGFSLSPGDADPHIELRTEIGQPVVRITATKATPYLALGGTIPDLPQTVVGSLRVHATLRTGLARPVLWQIHDASGTHDAAASVVESIHVRSKGWTRWTAQKSAKATTSTGGNFSVSITDVLPGDWFEISELTLKWEP